MTHLQISLLILFILGGLYAALAPALIQSAIGLAFTSIVLSILIYQLNAPLAAVFELSVCAGLITVVFVSAISLTRRLSAVEEKEFMARRFKRFVWLPVILALAALALYLYFDSPSLPTPLQSGNTLGAREALWGLRRMDMIGQMLIILCGVFGVVVLFKGWNQEGGRKW